MTLCLKKFNFIRKSLKSGGLSGLVALKMAYILIGFISRKSIDRNDASDVGNAPVANYHIFLIELMEEFRQIAKEYYIDEHSVAKRGAYKKESRPLDSEESTYDTDRLRAFPDYVRNETGDLIRITDAIKEYLLNDRYDTWLRFAPISMRTVFSIIESSNDSELEVILPILAKSNLVNYIYTMNLKPESVNRLINIMRNASDETLKEGCFIVLHASKFLKQLGSDELSKIMRSENFRVQQAVQLIFQSDIYANNDESSKSVLRSAAAKVFEDPNGYPQSSILSSALTKAKYEDEPLLNLLEQEETLQLRP